MQSDVVPPAVKSSNATAGAGGPLQKLLFTRVPDTAAWRPTCFLCNVQFASMEELREHEGMSALHRRNLASDVTRRPPPGVGNLRTPSASHILGPRDESSSARPPKCAGGERGILKVAAAAAGGDGGGAGTLDGAGNGTVDGAAPDASSFTTGFLVSTRAADNDSTNGEADDDGTVAIERESSAWDQLGERFELAASAGRYIDLTDDTDAGGGVASSAVELSASDAAAAFASASAEVPVDPASVCGSPTTATPPPHRSHPARPTSNNPAGPLRRLSKMISDTIAALREIRLMLQAELQTKQQQSHTAERKAKRRRCGEQGKLQSAVVGIDGRTRKIANFVRRHEGAVLDCRGTMGQLEDLNLLVMKANTLIAAVNRKASNAASTTSKSRAAKFASASASASGPSARPHRYNICGKTFATQCSLQQHRTTKGHLDGATLRAPRNEEPGGRGDAGGERRR